MSFRAFRLVVALAAGLLVARPGVAGAETDRDRAAARSAADAGADAFDAGNYARALELFGRAEQLVHAPTHLLFMARSLAKLGRLVEAHEAYLKIVNEQLPANAPKAFKSAHAEADGEIGGIEARIAHVTVTLGGRDAGQAALSIDRVEVPAAEQGIPIPMDPGTHVFSARRGEAQSEEKTVTLSEGDKRSIELTLPDAPPPGALVPQDVSPPAVPESAAAVERSVSAGPGSGRRVAAYTSLALGAAGVGVGSYFLVMSLHARHEADRAFACDAEPDGCDDTQLAIVDQHDHDADRSRNWAIAAYALGAAGLGTGIVLLVTAPHAGHARASPPIRDVQVTAGLAQIAVAGRF